MTGRMKLYIGLLALVIVILGGGIWFFFNPLYSPIIEIPESEPVISMESLFTGGGVRDRLYIYEDGSVIYTRDEGLRPGGSRTRTWNTGEINEQILNDVILLTREPSFAGLEQSYSWPEQQQSDLNLTLSVNYQNISKSVTVSGYPSPDGGKTYPDMPYPLDEIYQKLKQVTESTEEVYSEPIVKSSTEQEDETGDNSETNTRQEPVEIVSVIGPVEPINPGGPIVEITVKNTGIEPVFSLAASLELRKTFDFIFDVTDAFPLEPGQETSARQILITGGFSDDVQYPLTIKGNLLSGREFTYTKQVLIKPPADG